MNKTDDNIRELRAYKVGYDLGWYRAIETVCPLLDDLQSAIAHSQTMKEIEAEVKAKTKEMPLFVMKVLSLIHDLKTLKNEQMPALYIEQRAINDLGERLSNLPPEMFMQKGEDTKLLENL